MLDPKSCRAVCLQALGILAFLVLVHVVSSRGARWTEQLPNFKAICRFQLLNEISAPGGVSLEALARELGPKKLEGMLLSLKGGNSAGNGFEKEGQSSNIDAVTLTGADNVLKTNSEDLDKRGLVHRNRVPDGFWQTRESPDAADLDFRICTGRCNTSDTNRVNITIVTASSRNHFASLYSCLLPSIIDSVRNQSLQYSARIVVYDLAFGDLERSLLHRLEGQKITVLRQFPYHSYPPFFDVEQQAGEYAWKPVIIEQLLNEFQEPVLWVDSGSRILPRTLEYAYQTMNQNGGFFSPVPDGDSAATWTHPGMYRFFQNDTRFADAPNCDGSFGFYAPTERVLRDLVGPWRTCACARSCIAPPGSNRDNHRQDQAALTYLANRAGFGCEPGEWPGPVKWMDNDFGVWTEVENRTLGGLIGEMKKRGGDLTWQHQWQFELFNG